MQNQSSLEDSRKSILQHSALLNDTVVSPVHVDASMTKTSRKRFAINNLFSRTTLDLGQFNDSKLSPLYQSHYQQTQKGQIICIASIDKNNQVSITPDAIKLFKQYQKNPITFVGNLGKKDSGKSFWYDKILNLSEVEGAQYSKIQNNPGLYIWSIPFIKNNLRIFLIDYVTNKTGQNLSEEEQKLFDLQMILSQALVLIPDPDDKKLKIADAVYSNLNSSMGRLSDKSSKTSKQTPYWPHSLYSLYRSIKAVSPQTDKLSYLFSDYNYSIIHNALNSNIKANVSQLALMESSMIKGQSSSKLLNQTYVKRTSLVFKDIYRKLNGKKYEGLLFTGEILPFILNHSAKNLNSSKNIKVDKMFNDIKKDIYEKKLQAGKFIYNLNYDVLKQPTTEQNRKKSSQKNRDSKMTDTLKNSKKLDQNQTLKTDASKSGVKELIKVGAGQAPQSSSHLKQLLQDNSSPAPIQKPKPRPLDEVIDIFRKTNQNVLSDYHSTKYDPILHEEYEKKLFNYGQTKQKQVLDYNKAQTYSILSSTLPTFVQPKNTQELDNKAVLEFTNQLKISGLPLDHNRAKPVAQKLKDVALYAKKHQFFHVWMTEAYYKQRKLEMNVEDKKKELENLKFSKDALLVMNTHQDNEAEDLKDEHNRSTDKIEKVKNQLNLSKRLNANGISDQDYVKQLEKHKNKLQTLLKQNDKKIREVNLTPSKDPRIGLLQQKLDDKKTIQLQVQAGLSNLVQSRLNNSTSSVLTARKSQIRRIGEGGIKKSHLNKSMTK